MHLAKKPSGRAAKHSVQAPQGLGALAKGSTAHRRPPASSVFNTPNCKCDFLNNFAILLKNSLSPQRPQACSSHATHHNVTATPDCLQKLKLSRQKHVQVSAHCREEVEQPDRVLQTNMRSGETEIRILSQAVLKLHTSRQIKLYA